MLFVGQTLSLKSKLSGRWYVSSFYVSRKNVTTNHSRLSLPLIQSSISHTERRVKSVSCVSDSLRGLKLSSDDRRRALVRAAGSSLLASHRVKNTDWDQRVADAKIRQVRCIRCSLLTFNLLWKVNLRLLIWRRAFNVKIVRQMELRQAAD